MSDLEIDDPAEMLLDLLDELVERMGVDAEVSVEEGDGVLTGFIDGDDVDLVIGDGGETIEAIQHVAQRILFHGGPSLTRVVIDANGYRDRRASDLRREADEAADSAMASGSGVGLLAATASERRLVHEHLRDRGGVRTESHGEEPHRHLVVYPLESGA